MLRRLPRKVGLALVLAAPLLGLVGFGNGLLTACEPPSPGAPCLPQTVVHWFWGWTMFGAAAALAITGATAAAHGRGALAPTTGDTRLAYVAFLLLCLGAGLLVPTVFAATTTTCTIHMAADGRTLASTCPMGSAAESLAVGTSVALALVGAWGLAYRGALALVAPLQRPSLDSEEPTEPDTV